MSQSCEMEDPPGLEGVHKQHTIDQGSRTIKEIVKSWLPTEPGATLFTIVMLACLVIGIRSALAGNTSMLTSLLVYAYTYAGLPKVKAGLTEVKRYFTSGEKNASDEKTS